MSLKKPENVALPVWIFGNVLSVVRSLGAGALFYVTCSIFLALFPQVVFPLVVAISLLMAAGKFIVSYFTYTQAIVLKFNDFCKKLKLFKVRPGNPPAVVALINVKIQGLSAHIEADFNNDQMLTGPKQPWWVKGYNILANHPMAALAIFSEALACVAGVTAALISWGLAFAPALVIGILIFGIPTFVVAYGLTAERISTYAIIQEKFIKHATSLKDNIKNIAKKLLIYDVSITNKRQEWASATDAQTKEYEQSLTQDAEILKRLTTELTLLYGVYHTQALGFSIEEAQGKITRAFSENGILDPVMGSILENDFRAQVRRPAPRVRDHIDQDEQNQYFAHKARREFSQKRKRFADKFGYITARVVTVLRSLGIAAITAVGTFALFGSLTLTPIMMVGLAMGLIFGVGRFVASMCLYTKELQDNLTHMGYWLFDKNHAAPYETELFRPRSMPKKVVKTPEERERARIHNLFLEPIAFLGAVSEAFSSFTAIFGFPTKLAGMLFLAFGLSVTAGVILPVPVAIALGALIGFTALLTTLGMPRKKMMEQMQKKDDDTKNVQDIYNMLDTLQNDVEAVIDINKKTDLIVDKGNPHYFKLQGSRLENVMQLPLLVRENALKPRPNNP